MADFFRQILNLMGTFNLQLVFLLFLLCSFGELWLISIPYLLETVWLVAGYNLSSGALTPFHLLLLWLVAQFGRQTGVLLLFSFSRLGSLPLTRLYQKYVETRFKKLSGNENWLSKILKKLESHMSPFPIALGRLIGLGTPLTVFLGVKKQYKMLFLGVLLSSLVFDGIFIIFGLVVGANTMLKPTEMLLFSLIGLTGLYVVIFVIRQTSRFIKSRWIARNDQSK